MNLRCTYLVPALIALGTACGHLPAMHPEAVNPGSCWIDDRSSFNHGGVDQVRFTCNLGTDLQGDLRAWQAKRRGAFDLVVVLGPAAPDAKKTELRDDDKAVAVPAKSGWLVAYRRQRACEVERSGSLDDAGTIRATFTCRLSPRALGTIALALPTDASVDASTPAGLLLSEPDAGGDHSSDRTPGSRSASADAPASSRALELGPGPVSTLGELFPPKLAARLGIAKTGATAMSKVGAAVELAPRSRDVDEKASGVREKVTRALGILFRAWLVTEGDVRLAADWLREADQEADSLKPLAERYLGKKENQRREANASAALKAASEQCIGDGDRAPSAECKSRCKEDPAAHECCVIAMYLNAHGDAKGAEKLYRGACDAGNEFGCRGISLLAEQQRDAAERKKARAELPGLLTRCAAIKNRIIQLRGQVRAASRERNGQRLQELQPQLQEASDQLLEVGHKIDDTIATATGREEPEYRDTILKARKTCIP